MKFTREIYIWVVVIYQIVDGQNWNVVHHKNEIRSNPIAISMVTWTSVIIGSVSDST